MPVSLDILQKWIKKYDIHFEGPAPSKDWPANYEHLFHPIRNIWNTRDDKYTTQSRFGPHIRRKHRERAAELRKIAHELRSSTKVSESNLRHHIENIVLSRFRKNAKCTYCKKEVWTSDFEAEPLERDEAEKVRKKRGMRQRCKGHTEGEDVESGPDESGDDELGKIFEFVTDQELSKDLELIREKKNPPMCPDLIMGLQRTKEFEQCLAFYQSDAVHSPIIGSPILYPFMVFEAKQLEGKGFRSIETQSAFPIYRLLHLQDSLRKQSQVNFEPLLWFCGYQGDIWRLYAATLAGESVRIYDLWMGSIESHDSSLQLIQIFDFIWTWARDIYRPCIRRCLRRNIDDIRALSPTSTDALTRSHSVISDCTTIVGAETRWSGSSSTVLGGLSNDGGNDVRDGLFHPLYTWLQSHIATTTWSSQATIKHSNLVQGFFRILELPNNKDSLESLLGPIQDDRQQQALHLVPLLQQSHFSFPLTRTQVLAIGREWIGTDLSTSWNTHAVPDERLMAFFFFRNTIRREDWQVSRGIYCLLWSSETVKALSLVTQTPLNNTKSPRSSITWVSQVLHELLRVRDLTGSASLQTAFKEVTLVLSRLNQSTTASIQPHWTLPQGPGVSREALVRYRDLFSTVSSDVFRSFAHEYYAERLLWIHQGSIDSERSGIPALIPATEVHAEAVIISKPQSWPFPSPRFCLYILEGDEVDGQRLKQLLRRAIAEEWWESDVAAPNTPLQLSESDIQIFLTWIAELGHT